MGLTIVTLEVASATSWSYLAFAALAALVIPYRRPRSRNRKTAARAGILNQCAIVVLAAAWLWYAIAVSTAGTTPVAATPHHFQLGIGYGPQGRCIGLVDENHRPWVASSTLLPAARAENFTLYETRFGWTTESHPTESPSAFLRRAHLNATIYPLSPAPTNGCTDDTLTP